MNAFDNLSNLLTEMQVELIRREWSEDTYARIDQSVEFRGKLFEAIQDFAREQHPSFKVAS